MILSCLAAVLALSARAADAPVPARDRADAHFLAGFDHFRSGRAADARREWTVCRELDEKHDFCEFGLSVLDAGAPKDAEAPEAPTTSAPPPAENELESMSRQAQQLYLEGVIYHQKGDDEKARAAWRKAKVLAPAGSDAAKDAAAGLEKLPAAAPAAEGKAPRDLKTGPEGKDEHAALQAYFTGLIHYNKGDYSGARTEWTRSLALAPEGSSAKADAKAALENLDKVEASTRGGGKK